MFKLKGSTILESMMAVFVMSAGIGLFLLTMSQVHDLIVPDPIMTIEDAVFHAIYNIDDAIMPSNTEENGASVHYQLVKTPHPKLWILNAEITYANGKTVRSFQKLVSR